jgi:phosphoenolpyruvate---glycerone phosphotransferase subunit DhaK
MPVKKFINSVDTITDEMLEGLSLAFDEYLDIRGHIVIRKGFEKDEPRVTTMTMGGSGHEPSTLGFCGKGWDSIKVIGDVFAAPGPETVLEAIRIADRGKGILLYVGNHAGDVLSTKIAVKMARREGIEIEYVILADDISSFSREEKDQRRGMAASLSLGKVLGAAAESGRSLIEVKEIAMRYIDNVASLAIATRGATHPSTGQYISVIPEGQMIIGMGQHGEGNNSGIGMLSSEETVKLMADRIIEDISLKENESVITTVNGSGSTTFMELMILYKDLTKYLDEKGIKIAGKIVGEFLTTQEQAGFQMSMVRADQELIELFNAPCRTAFVSRH